MAIFGRKAAPLSEHTDQQTQAVSPRRNKKKTKASFIRRGIGTMLLVFLITMLVIMAIEYLFGLIRRTIEISGSLSQVMSSFEASGDLMEQGIEGFDQIATGKLNEQVLMSAKDSTYHETRDKYIELSERMDVPRIYVLNTQGEVLAYNDLAPEEKEISRVRDYVSVKPRDLNQLTPLNVNLADGTFWVLYARQYAGRIFVQGYPMMTRENFAEKITLPMYYTLSVGEKIYYLDNNSDQRSFLIASCEESGKIVDTYRETDDDTNARLKEKRNRFLESTDEVGMDFGGRDGNYQLYIFQTSPDRTFTLIFEEPVSYILSVGSRSGFVTLAILVTLLLVLLFYIYFLRREADSTVRLSRRSSFKVWTFILLMTVVMYVFSYYLQTLAELSHDQCGFQGPGQSYVKY